MPPTERQFDDVPILVEKFGDNQIRITLNGPKQFEFILSQPNAAQLASQISHHILDYAAYGPSVDFSETEKKGWYDRIAKAFPKG